MSKANKQDKQRDYNPLTDVMTVTGYSNTAAEKEFFTERLRIAVLDVFTDCKKDSLLERDGKLKEKSRNRKPIIKQIEDITNRAFLKAFNLEACENDDYKDLTDTLTEFILGFYRDLSTRKVNNIYDGEMMADMIAHSLAAIMYYTPESEDETPPDAQLDGQQALPGFDDEPPEQKPDLPRIEALSRVPTIHYKPIGKLSREMTNAFVNAGEIALNVARRGSKKPILTIAKMSYDDNKLSITGRAEFTPYDREVHDSVITLYEAGNTVITPAMVYRAMNGMSESEKVSPQATKAVKASLDKSRKTTLKIDYTQEAQAYNRDVKKTTVEDYLFSSAKIEVTAGGVKQEAYKFNTKPILYEYAQISGQVLNIPIALLQTGDAVRSTQEVIIIRGYLLKQIEGMKSETFNRRNNITYEGIYKELDITPDNYNAAMYKKKTHAIRQHTTALLDYWKKERYIKGYTPYKEGYSIKGVTISL